MGNWLCKRNKVKLDLRSLVQHVAQKLVLGYLTVSIFVERLTKVVDLAYGNLIAQVFHNLSQIIACDNTIIILIKH